MSNNCFGDSCSCGCCEGIEELTPAGVANRPGLGALSYRAGTHATFLETMKARLSSHCLDPGAEGCRDSARPSSVRAASGVENTGARVATRRRVRKARTGL